MFLYFQAQQIISKVTKGGEIQQVKTRDIQIVGASTYRHTHKKAIFLKNSLNNYMNGVFTVIFDIQLTMRTWIII